MEPKPRLIPGRVDYSRSAGPLDDEVYRDDLLNSSLLLAVGRIESARGKLPGSPKRTSPIWVPEPLGKLVIPGDETLRSVEGAYALLDTDREFTQMWNVFEGFNNGRKSEALLNGIESHLKFLAAFETPLAAKVFTATPHFQTYVSELAYNSGPGPFFYRVLGEAESGDLTKMAVMSTCLFSFARWDGIINWFEERTDVEKGMWPLKPGETLLDLKEDEFIHLQAEKTLDNVEKATQALDRFKTMTNRLFRIVTDTDDQSAFRRFLIGYFPAVEICVTDLGLSEEYHPEPEYQRIRQLFGNVPEDEWKNFADYLLVSNWHFYLKARKRIDKEVMQGGLTGANSLVGYYRSFQDQVHGMLTFNEGEKEVFAFWADEYGKGTVSGKELLGIPGNIQRINRAAENIMGSKDPNYQKKLKLYVTGLHRTPAVTSEIDEAVAIMSNGFFPTTILRRALSERGITEGIKYLQNLGQKTDQGAFDPANSVQRDLEFAKYIGLGDKPQAGGSYENFLKIGSMEESEEDHLDFEQRIEAKAAAFEAARVYWLIRQRAEAGRKLVVIGNLRYGDYFVVSPIAKELIEFDIKFRTMKIPSSGTNNLSVYLDTFSDSFIRGLKEEQPDLLIVDGTKNSVSGGAARFPSATQGYLNWFLAWNKACGIETPGLESHMRELKGSEKFGNLVDKLRSDGAKVPYSISHWTPNRSETVLLGQIEMPRNVPQDRGPEVIFINPVVNHPDKYEGYPDLLKSHKPGFLDDPDTVESIDPKLYLTNKGLSLVKISMTEAQFVRLVQEEMSRSLPGMLRLTDPLNF